MRNFLSSSQLYFVIFLITCSLIIFTCSFQKLGSQISPEQRKKYLKELLYSGILLASLTTIILLDGLSFVSIR